MNELGTWGLVLGQYVPNQSGPRFQIADMTSPKNAVQDMKVAWDGNFKMDEGLGFVCIGDVQDASGNIYHGPLTFNQVHSVPGFDIESSTGVTAINFPNLISIDPHNVLGGYMNIQGNTGLLSVSYPLWGIGGNGLFIFDNPLLTSIVLPAIFPATGNKSVAFTGNALSAACVNSILAAAVAQPAFTSGSINLSGGTSAAPSGQGQTDKATLIGRGISVTTN